MGKKNLKKLVVSFFLIFLSTLAALLLRQASLVEQSPSPEFRKKGPDSARIRIFEHSDFGCPACALSHKYLNELLSVYKEEIQLNFKHYPLPELHPNSPKAALYADCAGRQGKFWEFADSLFSEPFFEGLFRKLGLDAEKLKRCAADPETLKDFNMDVSFGDLKRIDATPTFFVNGERAVGPGQLSEKIRHWESKK